MSAVAESITTTGAWEWRATGTTWRIHHTGGVDAGLAATIAQAVERDEARWSRFRPDSEVARVNASAGRAVHVSPATLDLLEVCVYWIRATGGVFHRSSAAHWSPWGYRRSLNDRAAYARTSPDPRRLEGRPQIESSRYQGTAMIPAGTRLDLGGIAKSWMAARPRASFEDGVTIRPCWSTRAAISSWPAGDTSLRWRTLAHPMPRRSPESGSRRARASRPRGSAGAGGRTATDVPRRLIDPGEARPAHRTPCPTVVADDPVAADVLAKVLTLRPGRIAALDEAAMIMVDAGVRVTAAWAEVTA